MTSQSEIAENRARVMKTLEEIVEGAPDTVAECVYFEHVLDGDGSVIPDEIGPPVCILGHLIQALDSAAIPSVVELNAPGEVIFSTVAEQVSLAFAQSDWTLIDGLDLLQLSQDNGMPWSEALDEFKAYMARREAEH